MSKRATDTWDCWGMWQGSWGCPARSCSRVSTSRANRRRETVCQARHGTRDGTRQGADLRVSANVLVHARSRLPELRQPTADRQAPRRCRRRCSACCTATGDATSFLEVAANGQAGFSASAPHAILRADLVLQAHGHQLWRKAMLCTRTHRQNSDVHFYQMFVPRVEVWLNDGCHNAMNSSGYPCSRYGQLRTPSRSLTRRRHRRYDCHSSLNSHQTAARRPQRLDVWCPVGIAGSPYPAQLPEAA